MRPATLGQAARIEGITPGALTAPARAHDPPAPAVGLMARAAASHRDAARTSRRDGVGVHVKRSTGWSTYAASAAPSGRQAHEPGRRRARSPTFWPRHCARSAPSSCALAPPDASAGSTSAPAPAFRAWCWRSCSKGARAAPRAPGREHAPSAAASSPRSRRRTAAVTVDILAPRIETTATQAKLARSTSSPRARWRRWPGCSSLPRPILRRRTIGPVPEGPGRRRRAAEAAREAVEFQGRADPEPHRPRRPHRRDPHLER